MTVTTFQGHSSVKQLKLKVVFLGEFLLRGFQTLYSQVRSFVTCTHKMGLKSQELMQATGSEDRGNHYLLHLFVLLQPTK